jgi:hypothetical protein
MITDTAARAIANGVAATVEPNAETVGPAIDLGDWWGFDYGTHGYPFLDTPPIRVNKDTGEATTEAADDWTQVPAVTAAAEGDFFDFLFSDPGLMVAAAGEAYPLHGVLAPEGVRTGDGRSFAVDSLTWADLPLPLRVQNADAPGHDGSIRVGRIDTIERDTTGDVVKLRFTGAWAVDSDGNLTPEAAKARDEVIGGYLRGVSVDLDATTIEFVDSETGEPATVEDEEGDFFDFLFGDPGLMVVTAGRIRSAAMCSIPAFQEAYVADGMTPLSIEPGDGQEVPIIPVAASVAVFVSERPWGDISESDYTPQQWRDACLIHLEPAEGQDPLTKSLNKLPVYEPGGALNRGGCHAAASALAGGRGGVDAPAEAKAAAATTLIGLYTNELNETPPDSLYEVAGKTPPSEEAGASVAFTLVATAKAPTYSAADFTDPMLTEPTPLTVTDDGRVYGHLATWGTCHVGIEGVCVTPPHSETGYAYFSTGCVHTDAGDLPVGCITLGTGHAAAHLAARPAVAHYDDTGTAVAYVAAGEDAVGIWLAGRVRPDATDAQVAALTHSGAVSGDWRRIGTNLELVAALAVNVPGFPVPRRALAADAGRQTSLVAAGVVVATSDAAVDPDRIARQVLAMLDRRTRVARLSRTIGLDRTSRMLAAARMIGRTVKEE